MNSKQACILFSRSPFSTSSKTRLRNGRLSEDFVNQLHTAMVYRALDTLKSIKGLEIFAFWRTKLTSVEKELLYTKFPSLINRTQSGDFFAERFKNSFLQVRAASKNGDLLLIGSDCPYIDKSTITLARSEVKKGRLVFGPDNDCGFYLLGLPANLPVKDFTKVFECTNQKEALEELYKDNDFAVLNPLPDIDTIEDLMTLKKTIKSLNIEPASGLGKLLSQDF